MLQHTTIRGIAFTILTINLNPVPPVLHAQSANEDALVTLASQQSISLTPAETILLRAAAKGEVADLGNSPDNCNVITAKTLEWLLKPEPSALVTRFGLRIKSARITGEMNLGNADVSFALRCESCVFLSPVNFEDAQLLALDLTGSTLSGLNADRLKARGDVKLVDVVGKGRVRLDGIIVGGTLDLTGASFTEGESDDYGVTFIDSQISGSVLLENMDVDGGVCLHNSSIGGDLICTGARFDAGTGTAICAHGVQVAGDVYLNTCRAPDCMPQRFVAIGAVEFPGAAINGDLYCSGGEFRHNAMALNLAAAKITGSAFLDDDYVAHGEVRMVGAEIKGSVICHAARFMVDAPSIAINLAGAHIFGHVRLSKFARQLTVDGNKGIYEDSERHLESVGEVCLVGATIDGSCDCSGATISNSAGHSLQLANAAIGGDLVLGNAILNGAVSFSAARVGGAAYFGGSRVTYDVGAASSEQSRSGGVPQYAIDGTMMQINGSVAFEGAVVTGGVDLSGASIGQAVRCTNGTFRRGGRNALMLDNATIGSDVYLDGGFVAEGGVRCVSTKVRGSLVCWSGRFDGSTPGQAALLLDYAEVTNEVVLGRGSSQTGDVEGFRADGGVSLAGARIGKLLECSNVAIVNPGGVALNGTGADITGGVYLYGARIDGEVRFNSATIRGRCGCIDATVRNAGGSALSLVGAEISDFIDLSGGFNAYGKVNLSRAVVNGGVYCDGGRFDNVEGIAIDASGSTVGIGMVLRSTSVRGGVELWGCTIRGLLNCAGAELANANGSVLALDSANIAGDVLLGTVATETGDRSLTADGTISLQGTIIGGNLDCTGGRFGRMDLGGAGVAGRFMWQGITAPAGSRLNLRGARIGVLMDDAASWPAKGSLELDGCVYTGLVRQKATGDDDVLGHLDWLERDLEFHPGQYDQLSAVLASLGNEEESRLVRVAKERRRTAQMSGVRRAGRLLLDWTIGYGYDTWRAGAVAVGVVVLGAIVFGCSARWPRARPIMRPTSVDAQDKKGTLKDHYSRLNAMMYSIDAFVPLINFYQADYWLPDSEERWGRVVRWYLWVHIACGWVLTTLLAVGLTGLVRS